MESAKRQHHFVLVHGVCHGAWCWYRVTTILESSGHRVTALDMAGCGARPQRAEEVASFEEYSRPLLDVVAALPPGEKAILVGHSFGGQSLALAMERYPDKVAVAVFVSAAMPAAGKPMTLVYEQVRIIHPWWVLHEDLVWIRSFIGVPYNKSTMTLSGHLYKFSQERRPDSLMDCTLRTSSDPQNPVETFLLGPRFLGQKLYQLSPPEDLTLAKALVRPSQRFLNDAVMKGNVLTAERYGAARSVYVVAEDDASWSADFQRRMASWNPGTEVKELRAADHMPMFSKPRELSELLMEIAEKYC